MIKKLTLDELLEGLVEGGSKLADEMVVGGTTYKVGGFIGGKKIVQILPGTNGKIAVIGRGMAENVEVVANALKKEGKSVELFNADYQDKNSFDIDNRKGVKWDEIQNEFDLLKEKYGDIPDDVMEQSLMFKANQKWAQKLKKEGYNVIDIGNPSGSTRFSPSYDMEGKVIFNQ